MPVMKRGMSDKVDRHVQEEHADHHEVKKNNRGTEVSLLAHLGNYNRPTTNQPTDRPTDMEVS